jgi:hypothetical protein
MFLLSQWEIEKERLVPLTFPSPPNFGGEGFHGSRTRAKSKTDTTSASDNDPEEYLRGHL